MLTIITLITGFGFGLATGAAIVIFALTHCLHQLKPPTLHDMVKRKDNA